MGAVESIKCRVCDNTIKLNSWCWSSCCSENIDNIIKKNKRVCSEQCLHGLSFKSDEYKSHI